MGTNSKETSSDTQRIMTPEFRVSYPHLFKAQSIDGESNPKYSVTMLFNKKTDLSTIKLAIKHAKIAEFGPNQNNWPKNLGSPVEDGDNEKYSEKEGYAGHWAIKASSSEASKPGLVDQNVEPIIDQGDFYPGCYARAQVFARVWSFGKKQGVHFILDHVQKTRDGKSFSSRKDAKDVFSPVAQNDEGEDGADNMEDDDFT